jgi:hypothetical protein
MLEMKKTNLLLVAFGFCSISLGYSQQKVALHSSGTTTIFGGANPFTDAYNASVNGDTIYLPGGTIPFPSNINKGLVIIGAGHYPDSTVATGKTILSGNITISQDADNLMLEGIELGSITFTLNHKVDSVIIRRCKFSSIDYQGTGATPCVNNSIRENVITGGVTLTNATSSMLSNNIIDGKITSANNIGISNNILFYNAANPGGYAYVATFYNVDNCFISNNVIFRNWAGASSIYSSSDLNTFSNNLFSVTPNTGTNTFINNYNAIDLTTVFVNQTGNVFNYSQNYHLVDPSIYLGIDNTQVGIYGGLYPCKVGSVPQNPHIQLINNATTTDANGDLQIQIQVDAQNN